MNKRQKKKTIEIQRDHNENLLKQKKKKEILERKF